MNHHTKKEVIILSIWTGLFWKDTAERVLATVAQVLIAVLSVDGLNLVALDWQAIASAVAIAGALALLKAILANAVTGNTVSPASLAPDDSGL
jgi:hypothetical protein